MSDFTPRSQMVAEVQGLYGAFIFSERLLQKIWMRREFSPEGLRTHDGRALSVLHPGKWNRLGGPDFKDAKLKIGETEVRGDVELHLRVEDWVAHGHAKDAAYDGVVLHVVLFPTAEIFTRGAHDREIPMASLLPNLSRGLEEYATDDAVETLSGSIRSEVFGELGSMEDAVLRVRLHDHAAARWKGKLHYAHLRVDRLGWTQACHVTALEILGFRFNRAPMVRVATLFPLETWRHGELDTQKIMTDTSMEWRWQAVRPANHPRTRLAQYAQWVKHGPAWPDAFGEMAKALQETEKGQSDTMKVRRANRFQKIRTAFERDICGRAVGGSRLDTLICDGFLPLLSVHSGSDFSDLWFNWFVGDMPDELFRVLRELGIFAGRPHPACHGFAQGLLGWTIEREALNSLSEGLYRGGRLDNT